MIRKALWFLFVLTLVGLSLYFVYYNSLRVEVSLTPGWSFESQLGIVLIAAFVVGIIATALVASFFHVRSQFQQRHIKKQERLRATFFNNLVEARSLIATEQWEKAKQSWQRVIKRDPDNTLARIELARALLGVGEKQSALKALDAARAKDPENVELLLCAAETLLSLGNKTAAIDNLALVLYHSPSLKAAKMARELSEDLERFQDALEYHEKYIDLGGEEDGAGVRLSYQQMLHEHTTNKGEDEELTQRLREFSRAHGDYLPALLKLAELEIQASRVEEGVKLQLQAAEMSGDPRLWYEGAKKLVEMGKTERALAIARTAVRSSKGEQKGLAELYLAKLHIRLGMFEEAEQVLAKEPDKKEASDSTAERELRMQRVILSGYCHSKLEKKEEAIKAWKSLAEMFF